MISEYCGTVVLQSFLNNWINTYTHVLYRLYIYFDFYLWAIKITISFFLLAELWLGQRCVSSGDSGGRGWRGRWVLKVFWLWCKIQPMDQLHGYKEKIWKANLICSVSHNTTHHYIIWSYSSIHYNHTLHTFLHYNRIAVADVVGHAHVLLAAFDKVRTSLFVCVDLVYKVKRHHLSADQQL